MTDDPLVWLLGLEHLGMKFGLENMARLTAALDDPQRHFRSIHIAGTNGKGSVTAMVDTALLAAGYRSARYTSPHLERLEERFVVAGAEVSAAALRDVVGRVEEAVDRVQRGGTPDFSPTFFECATAAAFELFRREAVEIAVLEAGLGGRLDATNIVDPVVTAITSIDFDHQMLLGDTLEAIAREKAGIIKTGVPVVIGRLPLEAERVVREIAGGRDAAVVAAQSAGAAAATMRPALRGAHQRDNAAVAVAVLETLRGAGVRVPGDAIRAGVEQVHWPGRLEHIAADGVEFVLDAAHNPAGARALAEYLRDSGWTDAALVFGAMKDKDLAGMLRLLVPATAAIVCTTAPSPRAEPAGGLGDLARAISGSTVRVEADPAAAVALARTLSPRVVIAGSIFLIGALRGILR